MIEDTIEVLKSLSIFIADTRKNVEEIKSSEKCIPLVDDVVCHLNQATKSVEKVFDSISRIHSSSPINSLQRASSTFELIKLEDEIINMLSELSSVRIRLKVFVEECSKGVMEKVSFYERIYVIDDALRYFSKEKLSDQLAMQIKSSLETILSDTTLDEAEIKKVVQQSVSTKPDFTYRVRFVSEYPNLSSLMLKVSKKASG